MAAKNRRIYLGARLEIPADIMEATRARFEHYVDKDVDDPCWLWVGYRDDKGYGRFSCNALRDKPGRGKGRGRGNFLANRVAYALYKGPIPAGFDTHHTCENEACICPAHLELKRRASHTRAHMKTRVRGDAEEIPF